jgi:Skp family chaperone for outer membrane proteins
MEQQKQMGQQSVSQMKNQQDLLQRQQEMMQRQMDQIQNNTDSQPNIDKVSNLFSCILGCESVLFCI